MQSWINPRFQEIFGIQADPKLKDKRKYFTFNIHQPSKMACSSQGHRCWGKDLGKYLKLE